ncbi:hypothetical protein [Chryseobacterium populi]|uniref:Uncharacterized protein n=1 Tax=Chryseobacterium populi TaxID=1144316 RepID=J2ST49_9FLAO|nr:hypothetical protein [Chryseobacterium populi]EJL68757.1 hypothetical protein PMI13_03510 [Chryseobacterium populi]
MKKVFLLLAFIIFQSVFSQQPVFLKIKKYKINDLGDRLKESSGLNFFNGKLYSFNDSGNAPELFEIDKTSGEIIKAMNVFVKNKDWEALANDGKYFYIGDIGNNSGTRQDLEIYKISFHNNTLNNDTIKTISYYYPGQTDFSPKNLKTDFDAEAMIYLNGKLHIFTKEWASKSVTHYTVNPEISDQQIAEKTEAYKTGFVVTDASYFEGKLYLVGYTKKTEVFLDVFTETEPGIFFKERPKHYYLGSSLSLGQIEGVAADEKGVYISGEKFNSPLGGAKQSLYFVPKEKLED